MKFVNCNFETSCGTSKQLIPSDMPEVAFSGRSNVGKSSLLNKLLNRKALARVSSMPGKTVTINFFRVDDCRFVDLPGYGYAKVSHDEKIRWSELMESYFASGRDIRVVVQLIDMRHKPSEQDLDMIEYMVANKLPFIVALTKADKLNKTERMNCLTEICSVLAKYGNIPVVPFSSTKGDGVEELRGLISKYVEGE
ncbi:MAG: YihA family ribosome biogenesis GTP-binding protein [Clostridia bacterium]|nr:YihA family ribosome biogenesis GTP-binding protein [Clostridia bacterium]